MAVMPMFPLGMVLLPGGVLPLHVFEPRYRQMIIDILQRDDTPEFGQVLITHGSEAGGGDERSMIGTVAQMVQCEALDESRYAMVTVGTRRIRVNTWLPDDPYPMADVDDWPDADPDGVDGVDGVDLADAVAATHARVRSALAKAAELGDLDAAPTDAEISDDPLVATYHLASLAPIGPLDRHRLLAAPGPSERLATLDAVLDDVEAMLDFRLS
ncbi:LON peptidase substrate-binding domain-containing protein [Ilumatobacter coccineus]|uniref:Peptidase S16 family protein n=1 Tax=Ilumatobacter coccineus (strain NBRC 103263 / KCTC 29153 / YM16-304) TaxID=1313172 RepID=A0A6C7EA91_ILUCY|nr:LON peptidase substrate-binding domain-containing protein [Ilumatobacter coccineus]BAN02932.1 peptidase S16 family protein [Ilumatobacter coccineus YM16-304]